MLRSGRSDRDVLEGWRWGGGGEKEVTVCFSSFRGRVCHLHKHYLSDVLLGDTEIRSAREFRKASKRASEPGTTAKSHRANWSFLFSLTSGCSLDVPVN